MMCIGGKEVSVIYHSIVKKILRQEGFKEVSPATVAGRAFYYLCAFWVLFWGSVQQDVAFAGDIQVQAVCGRVIRHREFVVAMITHLLHDL